MRLGTFLGLALVSAGGISNLIDRLARHGQVTDFMVVQIGPFHTGIFNVADFAVALGVFLALVSSYARSREARIPDADTEATPGPK